MSLQIGPETKVGALLDAYPDLEPVLISMAPAFAKLRNPLLRRSVAKIATLEQAARIGGVPLPRLVCELRRSAGQSQPDGQPPDTAASRQEAEPGWVSAGCVRTDLDGDALLERGVHPFRLVREGIAELLPGEVLRLATSFRPQPLLDLLAKAGIDAYSKQDGPGRHFTYFRQHAA